MNTLEILQNEYSKMRTIFDEVTYDDDSFIFKQYIKVTLFLAYMMNQSLYENYENQFKKTIHIMRPFLEYRLFYMNNKAKINLPCQELNFKKLQHILNEFHIFSPHHTQVDLTQIGKTLFISDYIYNAIENIYNVENNILILKRQIQRLSYINNSIMDLQLEYLNRQKQRHSISNYDYKIGELENLIQNNTELNNNLTSLKTCYTELQYHKANEVHRNYNRMYCRNTILLNTNRFLQTLNPDVISHIRGYVGKSFLESVRVMGIQMKYFSKPKETIRNMLKHWSLRQLRKYVRNHYFMSFKFDIMDYNELFNYNGEDFLEHFYLADVDNRLSIKKKKNVGAWIETMLDSNGIVEYYNFQRDVWILTQIILRRQRNQRPE